MKSYCSKKTPFSSIKKQKLKARLQKWWEQCWTQYASR